MAIDRTILEMVWGNFENLNAFKKAKLQDGRFVVELNKGRFECLFFNKKSSDRLFILLSGARDPKTQGLPKFDRWSWYGKLPGSVLCISDPTLFLDTKRLRIGWYLGDEGHDWSMDLADLVKVCASLLNIPTKKIMAYGSSAGGFASLKLAAMLGDATAVAINPQTDALKYYEKAINLLLEVGYSGVALDTLPQAMKSRFSAIDALKMAPEARCLVVQNKLDEYHYEHHFVNLCDAFGVSRQGGMSADHRMVTIVYESPDGHGPEPKSMVDEIIDVAVKLSDAFVNLESNK